MKRFALALCWFGLLTLALSTVTFAAPSTSLPGAPALASACGATTAAPTNVQAFLAGLKTGAQSADTCTATCDQEHVVCRQECRDILCTVGFFSCNPVNPCAFVCECFCQ
jgi:hypothetical protein